MEFKGTKGKWVKAEKHTSKHSYITVQSENKDNFKQILFEYRISADDCTQSCCNKEQHANALLISKAPEMLEMLKRQNELIKFLKGTHYCQYSEAQELIKSATEL